MDLSGKRVLVTGGAGFIGSHLVEALVQQGCQVRALVHYNARGDWGHLEALDRAHRDALDVVLGDVCDPFSTARAVEGRDVVFHLAALIAIPYSYRAPQSYVSTNVVGTLNVLEACRAHGVERLVHTSTSETYGTAEYTPIDERHPLQGQSPYSATKIAADKLAESYYRSFNVPVTTLRPFNTFGPRQSARAIIPTIIAQALGRSDVRLGSLMPVRDLTFVTDTAAAFVAAAQCDDAVGRVVNCGNGKGLTIGDLAARILRLMGLTGTHRIVSDAERVRPDKSEVFELICDNSLALSLLGWRPTVSLDDGLVQAIDYVRLHRDQFKADQYVV
jgi:NAD dependent epimerase/dehydratase